MGGQDDFVEKASDDFYIYIYDEEENQQKFNFQKSRKGRSNMQAGCDNRKIGFWCFSASLGIRALTALKPRSLILTSGTLSPMESF